MSDDHLTDAAWVPDACTLPTADRPLRRVEFDDLFTTVDDIQRITPEHARLHLSGGADLAGRVRDLAARESDCCSFFAFTVTSATGGRVVFDIEVPERHVDVLDALLARAAQVGAGQ